MVTKNNPRVEKGIGGIPEILTKHHSIDPKSNYEYRPVVLISYALEFQFFGRNPHLSHFFNVLIYSFCCLLIFYLLSVLAPDFYLVFPFLTTLLFASHPIHTEVVNNLKSRDELFALFFSLLALISFIRYADLGKNYLLLTGLILLFLGILSKKSAVIFIPIVPLSLYFFRSMDWKKIFFAGILTFTAWGMYALFKKIMISEAEVREFSYFENPLFYEKDFFKRIPMGLYTLWYYFKLLVFPHPLSFYYGYNQIPIAEWSRPEVWFSMALHLLVLLTAIKLFKKKYLLSFAIIFYLIAIFPFSNLPVPVVGIIGERFVFIASFGFSLSLAFLIMKIFNVQFENPTKKQHNQIIPFKTLPLVFSTAILLLYSFKTISRNHDWKDCLTLYRHDIKHLENSAKAHSIIGNTIYPDLFNMPSGIQKNNLIKECILHYKKSLEIYPDYIVSNNNLGSIYFTFLGDYKTAGHYFSRAVLLDPNYLEAHYNLAYTFEKEYQTDSAIFYFEKTLAINPNYKPSYDRLHNLYFSTSQYEKAIDLNLLAASNIPDFSPIYFVNAGNIYSLKKDTLNSLKYFIMAFEKEPNNKDLCTHIANVCLKIRDPEKAEKYFRLAEGIEKNARIGTK